MDGSLLQFMLHTERAARDQRRLLLPRSAGHRADGSGPDRTDSLRLLRRAARALVREAMRQGRRVDRRRGAAEAAETAEGARRAAQLRAEAVRAVRE